MMPSPGLSECKACGQVYLSDTGGESTCPVCCPPEEDEEYRRAQREVLLALDGKTKKGEWLH